MRSNTWNLVWTLIGAVIIMMTFVNTSDSKIVFGIEIDIWVYRGLWGANYGSELCELLKKEERRSRLKTYF